MALSQIIVPGKKTKGLALRVDSSARGLKDGDPVLVERLVIHRASSEELVLGLMRKAGARDLHPVEIEVGGERRSSFLSLDSEAVEIAIGPGKGRLLRFGVAFPAAGTVGHSSASLIEIEVVAEADREDVLFREDYRVPEEGSTELVSDRWFEKSMALPDIRDRAVLRLTARSAGEGSVLAAFGAIVLSGPEREKPPPNVILISIDTLRGDRLGLNGGEHNQGVSPALDRFSQEAIVFDGAIAQAPFTLPSHVSMMSGQYPSVHGVGLITQNINPLRTPVLGDLLSREGYLAGAFTGGGFVHHKVGFGKGFDTYCVLDPLGWDTMGRSLDWVRANQSVPFFLFFHTYAVHEFAYDDADYLERFDPSCRSQVHHVRTVFDQLRTVTEPEEYVEADFRCLDNRYAAGIRMTDDAIGKLLDCLSSEGMLDNTLLIITSDHGQELLEHGAVQHGLSLYEELVHVPLIIRLPGGGDSMRRISDPVQVVDIFPSVLEYLGIDVPVGIQGQSLLTYLEGNDSDPMRPAAFSEVDYSFGKIHPRIAALRSNHWKLIHNLGPLTTSGGDYTEFEFFDLGEDPGESQNLAGQSESYEGFQDRLNRLRETLARLSEHLDRGPTEEGEMDPEILEQLRELGYIR